MKYSCRCPNRQCHARKTLARHPDDYIISRRCEYCRSLLVLDSYRQKGRRDKKIQTKDRGGKLCNDWQCDLHHMHRKASLGCFYHKDFMR